MKLNDFIKQARELTMDYTHLHKEAGVIAVNLTYIHMEFDKFVEIFPDRNAWEHKYTYAESMCFSVAVDELRFDTLAGKDDCEKYGIEWVDKQPSWLIEDPKPEPEDDVPF